MSYDVGRSRADGATIRGLKALLEGGAIHSVRVELRFCEGYLRSTCNVLRLRILCRPSCWGMAYDRHCGRKTAQPIDGRDSRARHCACTWRSPHRPPDGFAVPPAPQGPPRPPRFGFPEAPAGCVRPRMLLAPAWRMPVRPHTQVAHCLLDEQVRAKRRPGQTQRRRIADSRLAGSRHLGVRNERGSSCATKTSGFRRSRRVPLNPGKASVFPRTIST